MTLHTGDPISFKAPPYLANLIVIGESFASQLRNRPVLQAVFESVRPYGGALWLPLADDAGPDWEVTSTKTLKLKLRAERDDNGNGRVYTIAVEGKDSKGNLYLCTTTVSVPKNAPPKGKKDSKKGGKK